MILTPQDMLISKQLAQAASCISISQDFHHIKHMEPITLDFEKDQAASTLN
jgi:hypothetical protein